MKPTKAQLNKAYKTQDELYSRAIGRYLDQSDFDVTNHLYDEEVEQYATAYKLTNGSCPFCGEDTEDCTCKF